MMVPKPIAHICEYEYTSPPTMEVAQSTSCADTLLDVAVHKIAPSACEMRGDYWHISAFNVIVCFRYNPIRVGFVDIHVIRFVLFIITCRIRMQGGAN